MTGESAKDSLTFTDTDDNITIIRVLMSCCIEHTNSIGVPCGGPLDVDNASNGGNTASTAPGDSTTHSSGPSKNNSSDASGEES